MEAVVVANGELHATGRITALWQNADLRIAADGGARNAREQLELPPHIVVGDLDSLDPDTGHWLEGRAEFIRHPVAKDETDLELAVNLAYQRGAEHVALLGASGGRLDQSMANALLLARIPNTLLMVDRNAEALAATDRVTIEGEAGDTVSLIPLDARVLKVRTWNLQYPLQDEDLARGETRGISNRMLTAQAHVSWQGGLLLVVHLFGVNA